LSDRRPIEPDRPNVEVPLDRSDPERWVDGGTGPGKRSSGIAADAVEGEVLAETDIPNDLRYTRDDEWCRSEGERVVIGVTDYAQQQLGDIVFVELPAVGRTIEKGEPFGVIESVKAVSDLYAPVSGEVVEVNPALADHPEHVNEDCYGDGWMIAVAPSDAKEIEALLGAEAYRKHVEERSSE
jgi:glycine cleavage system H protein